ncbi:acetyl-CoA carboxylase biotin carboxyl carrier protein [Haliscomenobacter hydrossis]|uniref:Biotin carboxyl carrier protein of acetyl-CoA carboxylase n=1 Tax=Haliscomenobacter hydrossis (strain ATCC 27775 / DSM 1100 / LMG 10767 / O) TaxID=760192 RepID=F4KXL8_HALH1|nr:acetyl-CoA carboxylase biotin carboxyl carrier protein [Haliscomenobacter hydrossis]AEE50389.1 acetyl-CoA carboxylase, biotin carboxyl carrier protein [Haliscomenobacter hydrossis DSM 1100]
MDAKEIQELLKLVSRLELSEFKMKDGEFELQIRTKYFGKGQYVVPSIQATLPQPVSVTANSASLETPAPVAAPTPASAADPAPSKTSAAGDESRYKAVKSPIVGTFYRSAGPDKPAFVKVGDTISVGSVVCIVEAMKLFNEIEADISGTVVKVLVEDAQPVEYDQVLFLVDPK